MNKFCIILYIWQLAYLDFQGLEIFLDPYIFHKWQLPQQELVWQQEVKGNPQNLPIERQRTNSGWDYHFMLLCSMRSIYYMSINENTDDKNNEATSCHNFENCTGKE